MMKLVTLGFGHLKMKNKPCNDTTLGQVLFNIRYLNDAEGLTGIKNWGKVFHTGLNSKKTLNHNT